MTRSNATRSRNFGQPLVKPTISDTKSNGLWACAVTQIFCNGGLASLKHMDRPCTFRLKDRVEISDAHCSRARRNGTI
jgi:hypothetical protein